MFGLSDSYTVADVAKVAIQLYGIETLALVSQGEVQTADPTQFVPGAVRLLEEAMHAAALGVDGYLAEKEAFKVDPFAAARSESPPVCTACGAVYATQEELHEHWRTVLGHGPDGDEGPTPSVPEEAPNGSVPA
jgi:hypothetical protein